MGALGAFYSVPAFAQNTPQDTQNRAAPGQAAEKIVVTGRRAVATPLSEIKRTEAAIVDSLTSAQIERLPDTNLAQSLDRIVGVSSDRGFSTSEGRTVTVRGLDSRYNSMTVDGTPIWNSSRNNRGTQLDVFPASIVGQVDVFKTVTPDMDANSLGGHIAMRTLRAFDGGKQPYFRARASYGSYDQSGTPNESRPSYRLDAGGKFTFGPGNNYGIVLGVDYQQHEFFDVVNEVTSYSQIAEFDVLNGNANRGIFQRETESLSAYAKFEARASDKLYAFISASYYDDSRDENWNRAGVFTAANRVTGASRSVGSFTGATAENYFETYLLNRQTLQLAGGVDYRIGATSALTVRASYLNYDHDEKLFRSERFQLAGLSGSYAISNDTPVVSLSQVPGLNDPSRWLHRTGRNAFDLLIPHEDQVSFVSADFRHNTQQDSQGFGFQAGLSLRRMDRDHDRTSNNWLLPTGTVFSLANVSNPSVNAQELTGTTPFFIDTRAYRTFLEARGTFSRTTDDTSDYKLFEDVAAGYGSVTYDFGALRLLGGLRVEETRFKNTTAQLRSGAVVADVRSRTYTNVLPNAQATFDVSEDVRLRASYTNTIARPDFVDFAFGQTVTFDGNGFPIVAGANSNLGPRVSSNFDFSLDRFFANGFVSVGLFTKDIEKETFRQLTQTRNANGIVILTETFPLNTGSAKLTGFEVSVVQTRLPFLPAPLDGLGYSANFTLLDGDWNVVFTDGSRRSVGGLRNQPKFLANLNLTYEQGPFDATLAYRMRGRTFTGTFGTTKAGDLWVDAYNRLDLSANLAVAPGLKLNLQIRNINDAVWIEQTGIDNKSLSASYAPGRTLWLGVTWKPALR